MDATKTEKSEDQILAAAQEYMHALKEYRLELVSQGFASINSGSAHWAA
jgi:hypothetical protein